MLKSPDNVVIVGAGAAGLAAASRLREQGVDFSVLEARDRIGGRIWTLRPADSIVPVELGAEFLHGETEELDALLRRAGLRAMDVAGRRWASARGRLRLMDDFWERLDRVMRRLSQTREPDRSFAAAVAAMRPSPSPSNLRLAQQYVEGFHAAELDRVSEHALAEGGSPRDEVRERRIGRVLEGYASIIDVLASAGGVLDRIRLGSVVKRVRWGRHRVEIEGRDHGGLPLPPVVARAAIVTVPLGVLQAPPGAPGGIEFDPPLAEHRRAAALLAMGTVIRVTLQFDAPFWAEQKFAARVGDERLDTLSFLHSADRVPFPVWWTPYPVRAPLLVGWRGGPGALAMAAMTRDEIVAGSIASLASLLGMTTRALRRRIVAAFTHDWSNDPFACGAYSYVLVGGDEASDQLAKPAQGTLFIAGEHADREGRNGTVHGAVASGYRAADQAIKSLRSG